jgi:hypothetical protein
MGVDALLLNTFISQPAPRGAIGSLRAIRDANGFVSLWNWPYAVTYSICEAIAPLPASRAARWRTLPSYEPLLEFLPSLVVSLVILTRSVSLVILAHSVSLHMQTKRGHSTCEPSRRPPVAQEWNNETSWREVSGVGISRETEGSKMRRTQSLKCKRPAADCNNPMPSLPKASVSSRIGVPIP